MLLQHAICQKFQIMTHTLNKNLARHGTEKTNIKMVALIYKKGTKGKWQNRSFVIIGETFS